MINSAKISAIVGILLILLACTLPFNPYMSEGLEDIVFFRFILIGSLCFSYTCAVVYRENFCLFNIIMSMAGGILGLLAVSTARLIYVFDTKWYFYIPILISIFGVIIITIIRLWYNRRQSLYSKSYNSSV